MNFRAMMAAAGVSTGVDWSAYDATGDKTPVEFSSSAVRYCNVVPIDDTRALLVYRGASSYGRARIVTVDGSGSATFGTETVLYSAAIADAKATLLDSTHAIIVVKDNSSGEPKAIAIAFSGTAIDTVGSAVTVQSSINCSFLSVAGLSSSSFFAGYRVLTSTSARTAYGTVSGTTITIGSITEILGGITTTNMNMCKLTSSTCLAILGVSGAHDVRVYLISQSGGTPSIDYTLDSILETASNDVNQVGLKRMDDNTVIAYWTQTFSNICQAVIVTESGGSLSAGTVEQYSGVEASDQSIALPDSEHAVVTLRNSTSDIRSVVLEISGTTLNALSEHTNISGSKEYVSNGRVGGNWVVAAYADNNDSAKGKIIVLGV